jgi:hypothetical protein
MENKLSVEDALTNVDNAIAQLNANRQTHMILQASVQRIKDEVNELKNQVQEYNSHMRCVACGELKEFTPHDHYIQKQ